MVKIFKDLKITIILTLSSPETACTIAITPFPVPQSGKLAALSPRDEKHAAPSPVGEGWEGGCNKTGIDGVSGYQGRPMYFTSQMTFAL